MSSRTEEDLRSEREGRILIPAIALALRKHGLKQKSVFNVPQVANIVEQVFGLRPADESVRQAFNQAKGYSVWHLLGEETREPHIEVTRSGVLTYIGALSHIEDSELYALQTIGAPHLRAALKLAGEKAKEDHERSIKSGSSFVTGNSFDELRDGLSFLHGIRLYERSGLNRAIFKREEPNWSKSAAIAAWIIIPVTIVGIIVTYLVAS